MRRLGWFVIVLSLTIQASLAQEAANPALLQQENLKNAVSWLIMSYRQCGRTKDDPVLFTSISRIMSSELVNAGMPSDEAQKYIDAIAKAPVAGPPTDSDDLACETMAQFQESMAPRN